MRNKKTLKTLYTLFVVFFVSMTAGCNSGDGNFQVASGGISGTGISVGPITGFGSVYVDGLKYDTTGTEFYRNGEFITQGQDAFSLGEVISLTGEIDSVTGERVATRIDFESAVIGTISSREEAGEVKYSVLGYDLEVDPLTLIYGADTLSHIPDGAVLDVSGAAANDRLLASTIRVQDTLVTSPNTNGGVAEEVVATQFNGEVEQLDTANNTFNIRDVKISYAQSTFENVTALTLKNGDYVRVTSLSSINSSEIIASKVELRDRTEGYEVGQSLGLQGLIEDVASAEYFTLDGIQMRLLDDTTFIYGSRTDIAADSLVKVDGTMNADRVLELKEVTVLRTPNSTYSQLEGVISGLDYEEQTLTMFGVTFKVDDAVMLLGRSGVDYQTLSFENLLVGDVLRVVALYDNGVIIPLRIDRVPRADSNITEGVNGVLQIINNNGTLQTEIVLEK